MDIPIIIPCYFTNEESNRLEQMEEMLGVEIETNMDDVYDIRPIYFFSVDYAFEHPNGKDTMIASGVEEFRTPLKLKEVLALLK